MKLGHSSVVAGWVHHKSRTLKHYCRVLVLFFFSFLQLVCCNYAIMFPAKHAVPVFTFILHTMTFLLNKHCCSGL